MNKRPSLQFYPADWLKAPDLQMCSMNTIGIWINLMCRMWEAKEEGILRGKIGELALLVGAKPSEFKRFLKEAKEHQFCDVLHDVTNSYSNVTIKCRRMNKVFLEREGAKRRMQKHRSTQCDADVTPYSSTSSSSSTSRKEYTSEFNSFWKKWKGRYNPDSDRDIKVGKYVAFSEWKRLTIEEQRRAWEAADKVSGKYTPDANRWLKRKMYDDFAK